MSEVSRMRMENFYLHGDNVFKPGTWKIESDHIITPEVITSIYSRLVSEDVIPSLDKDFVLLSPSANIPTHELTLFGLDSHRRKGKATFLVGDLLSYPLTVDQISQKNTDHRFQYFQWNAQDLPLQPHSVDIIWDRKGWLWYAAKSNDKHVLKETFVQYYRILKPHGAIVVDDIMNYEQQLYTYFSRESFVSRLSVLFRMYTAKIGVRPKLTYNQLIPIDTFYQAEQSTFDNIEKNLDAHSATELSKLFTLYRLGSRASSIAIYQKHA